MIPWLYQNKYYIIYLCFRRISINNIFEDECYANLSKGAETHHYFGFLYNNNYLCVTDNNSKFIKIWDLIHKNIWKEFNYDDTKGGLGIIQWNKIYTIVAGTSGLIVVNIEEGKMTEKIITNNKIYQIKKIKTSQLGECLICSDCQNNIIIYKL